VLYSLVGSYGISVLVRDDTPFCIQRHIGILRPSPEISSAFLALALSSRAVFDQATQYATGTAQLTVPLSGLRRIHIPLPPRLEQERIVAAIEEQFSRLDAGVTALERARNNLKRVRTAVLLTAVTGRPCSGDDLESGQIDLPTDWSWRPLGEIIETLRNGIFVSRPVVEPSGLPILRISAVRPMILNVEDVRYVPTEIKLNNVESYIIEPGDLLFTRYSGNPEYVGACAMVPDLIKPVLHPDKLIRVKMNRAIAEPRFMEIAASVGVTRQAIRSRVKTTAGQTGISGSDLKAVPFPVPPMEIQHRIIDEVNRVLVGIQRTDDTVGFAERRSSGLRSSILAAGFSGKLVPQGLNDEPASALLERIAAKRTASNGHRTTRARKRRAPEQEATA
jgi:type I restriction enzyme, S subunit